MEPDPFTKLTPQEIEELSLCGITSAAQMATTDPQEVLEDLEKAQRFFPGRNFTLNSTKLQAIYDLCRPALNVDADSESDSALKIENVGPTTRFRTGRRPKDQVKEERRLKKYHQKKIMHSPVCTNHPVLAIFASFGTLLLAIPAVSIVMIPILMLTNNLPDIPLPILAGSIIIAPCLPYLFISRAATCPVCHMRLFTFRDYARNRAANYLPGLGYNVATALYIIFCLRYNCPGCGTPVKLFGKHRGRHIHH